MQVLACSDTTDAWKLIKDIPPRMIDCHRLMEICFKSRINVNVFDEGTSLPISTFHYGDDDDDDSDAEDGIPSALHSTVTPESLPPIIANDPLRLYIERNEDSSSKSAANSNPAHVRYFKRGVGSISNKMIAHYRALCLNERRERGINAPVPM